MRRLLPFIGITVLLAAGVFGVVRGRGGGAAALGSDQPLAIGTGVALDPRLSVPATTFNVAAGTPLKGAIIFQTYKPPSIGRPTHGGHVAFAITATLDVSAAVPVSGSSAPRVVVDVERQNRHELSFVLPALDAGHHCLVVAALEDPATSFTKEGALSHRGVFAVDISVGIGPDHCRASQAAAGTIANDLPIACNSPVLSPEANRTFLGGRFHAGTPLWAQVPAACPGATALSVVYQNEQRPVLGPGRFRPITFALDGNKRVVPLGAMPKGTWWIVLVVSGQRTAAYIGPPVLVE
jgi:hypothetical protein